MKFLTFENAQLERKNNNCILIVALVYTRPSGVIIISYLCEEKTAYSCQSLKLKFVEIQIFVRKRGVEILSK